MKNVGGLQHGGEMTSALHEMSLTFHTVRPLLCPFHFSRCLLAFVASTAQVDKAGGVKTLRDLKIHGLGH